jgi:hypothetical protein
MGFDESLVVEPNNPRSLITRHHHRGIDEIFPHRRIEADTIQKIRGFDRGRRNNGGGEEDR